MVDDTTQVLELCHALQAAGLWLTLHDADTLVLGPPQLVSQHPDLVAQVRAAKPLLLAHLRLTLDSVPQEETPGVFLTERCPACSTPCQVMLSPRRLAPHLAADHRTSCPGSERAQYLTAERLLSTFIAERCLHRPGSVLTWMAFKGALASWALERDIRLPPRAALLQWLDAQYPRMGTDAVYPAWRGLAFTVEEWLGPDELPAAAPAGEQRRLVLTARRKT
jgi:hypothetical protein